MEKTKLQESVAELMKDNTKRDALAEMITEYIEPGHIIDDWMGMLLNYRALNVGDILQKKVRKGIKVWSHVMGSIPLRSEITIAERLNYILDTAIVSVNANVMELESGELGTIDSIANEMRMKLRDYMVNKVFTALTTIWTAANTPSNYTAVGGNITKTALDAAINQINQTTPGAKAIVGSRVALQPITTFAQWDVSPTAVYSLREQTANEIFNTGWLGSYQGIPIIVAKQSYDYPDTYNKQIPEDKVLVIGENVGEFITYGGVNDQQFTDMRPVPPEWNYSLYTQFGFLIDNAMGLYVIGGLS